MRAAVIRWRPSRTKRSAPARVRRTGGALRPSSSQTRYRSIFVPSRPRSRRRMSASGIHVDVSVACAKRLLSHGRVECGRVESNHHSRWRRGYSALSSPMLGVRRERGRPVGLEPTLRGSQPRMLTVTPRPPGCVGEPMVPPTNPLLPVCAQISPCLASRAAKPPSGHDRVAHGRPRSGGRSARRREKMEGGIGSPQPGAETLPSDGPGASCFTFRQSCQRRYDAATPSPVGPGGLSAQLHVRARALPSPCSVTSSARPSTGRSSSSHGAGGIRTHGLELMRLARTAAPLPRVALSRERRSGRQDSNLRSPTPEVGGVADLPYDQSSLAPRQDSNLRQEG